MAILYCLKHGAHHEVETLLQNLKKLNTTYDNKENIFETSIMHAYYVIDRMFQYHSKVSTLKISRFKTIFFIKKYQ